MFFESLNLPGKIPTSKLPERPKKKPIAGKDIRDSRLPMPGSVITKDYKGKRITVQVLEDGFEYDGCVYKSLSAVAKAVTGSHWNGLLFFHLK